MLHYVLQKEARRERERATKDEWMREGGRTERNKRKVEKKEENSLLSKLAPFIWTNNYLKYKRFSCVYMGATLSWILKLYI